MKQKLTSIGSILGSIGFIISVILGICEVEGRYVIDLAKGVKVGIYPAVIGVTLLIIAGMLAIKDAIKK